MMLNKQEKHKTEMEDLTNLSHAEVFFALNKNGFHIIIRLFPKIYVFVLTFPNAGNYCDHSSLPDSGTLLAADEN